MDKLEFRLLEKEEIECRVQQVMKDNSGCILLLYKTARTDYNLLDETIGAMNWQCDYKEIKGNLYCYISIYNKDLQQWITKSNCGVESNTEAEKGEASDSLKRAGFVWGIGRELYTAPFTYIRLTSEDFNNSKLKTSFKVKEIGYTNRTITKLVIEDNKGNIRFKFGSVDEEESAQKRIAKNKALENQDKENIKPQTKTPKNAEKQEIKDINEMELPFDIVKEEKAVEDLTYLHDKIAQLNFDLKRDTLKCYEFFCGQFGVDRAEDLSKKQLEDIVNKLQTVYNARQSMLKKGEING